MFTKKRIYLIILSLFIILGSLFYYNTHWKRSYNQGLVYIKNNDYQNAIIFFDKTIKTNPNCYIAYKGKALALDFIGQYDEAIKTYDIALSLEPENNQNFLIYSCKANIYARLMKVKEAIENAKKSIDTNKNPINYNIQGAMFGLIGCYQEAIDSYNKAIEQNPNHFEPYKNKFCPLCKLGRYEEALEACNKAITLKPNHPNIDIIYTNKALVLSKLGRYEEALNSANKALTLNQKNQAAIDAKNQALELLKNRKNVNQLFSQ